MKLKRFLLGVFLIILCLLFPKKVQADVHYSIPYYQGDLTIDTNNQATYRQTVVYHFYSSYHGQYITLGTADMPKGFSVDANPYVYSVKTVEKDGTEKIRSAKVKTQKVKDGYKLKLYDSGKKGDTVYIQIDWKMKNLTTIYSDIAELSWRPISDWDVSIDKAVLNIKILGYADSKLFVHRGLLQKKATISDHWSNYHIEADHIKAGGILELHGYWQASYFDNNLHGNKTGVKQFNQKEEKIIEETKLYKKRLTFWYPLTEIVLLLVAVVINIILAKKLNKRYVGRHVHSFDIPEDLSPLELARKVYEERVSDVAPPVKARDAKDFPFSFKNLMSAMFLDLIDQNKLLINEKYKTFEFASGKHYTEEERAFLTFAFGRSSGKPLSFDMMFADYKKGSKQPENARFLYKKRLRNLDRAVMKKVSLSPSLTETKRGFRKNRYPLGIISLLLLWLAFVLIVFAISMAGFLTPALLFVNNLPQVSLINAVIAIIACLLLFKSFTQFRNWQIWVTTGITYYLAVMMSDKLIGQVDYTWGVLFSALILIICCAFLMREADFYQLELIQYSADGIEERKKWDSFENTLRDIKRFDKESIDSLVVWNRVLVYATLYGYTKRIQAYFKKNAIKVDNLNLDLAVKNNVSNRFATYTREVSSYTPSSSSGFTTGSSSGGFSGGGGGGGGGAF